MKKFKNGRRRFLGGNVNPGNNAPLNYKEIPMSEKTETVVEATKIVGKYVLIFAVLITAIKSCTWLYIQYGVQAPMAELYGIATFMVPFFAYMIVSMVWSEAKHRVWMRNNSIE